jgi:stage II sporulation protein D
MKQMQRMMFQTSSCTVLIRTVLVLLLIVLAGHAAAQMQVRVLLEQAGNLTVSVNEAHRGYLDGQLLFETPLPLDWPLVTDGQRIVIDGRTLGRTLTLEPRSGLFTWQGQEYRGALSFTATDDGLLVVNTLDLEDYLRGVVPSEMQATWPAEALKAQAIAARSYTLTSLQPEADYDICATVECQVYRGLTTEHALSDAAIRQTSGLVLTYADGFAKTYYHSDSGGVIASSEEVWGSALPYLQAFTDVTQTTPHRHWEQRIDPARLTEAVRAAGFEIGTATALTIHSRTESGRIQELHVSGTAGSAVLNGAAATTLLRAVGLKSTLLAMTGPLTARGDGWGHGVGMSQHGAMALAESGYSYQQILSFYYPGTELRRLSFTGNARDP